MSDDMFDALLADFDEIEIEGKAHSRPNNEVKIAIERSVNFVKSLPPPNASWDRLYPQKEITDMLTYLELVVKGETLPSSASDIFSSDGWGMFVPSLFVLLRRLRDAPPLLRFNRLSKIILAGSIAKRTAVSASSADLDIVLLFEDFQATKDENDKLVEWVEKALKSGGDIGLELSLRSFLDYSGEHYYFGHLRESDFENQGPEIKKSIMKRATAGSTPATVTNEKHIQRRCPQSTGYGYYATPPSPHPAERKKSATEPKPSAKYVHVVGPSGVCSADILLGGIMPPIKEAFSADHRESWIYWSASSAPLCVEFVSRQPEYVRTAIRVLKAWRNELGIRKSRFRPSSLLWNSFASILTVSLDPPDRNKEVTRSSRRRIRQQRKYFGRR
jgi:hypothetical protein